MKWASLQEAKNGRQRGSGRAPLSGESEGDLKKSESIGKMCLCKKTQQSRWTRRKYFARMRCVLQEANENRAPSSSMIAKGNAIAVRSANRPSTRVGERCLRGCASQWS